MKNIYLIKFNEERSSTLRKLGASAKVYLISTIILFLFGCASTISQKTEAVNIDKLYSPKELKEDLGYLFQTMENVHPNLYAYVSKEKIGTELQIIKRQLNDSLTIKEFYNIIDPIIVKQRDGHTWTALPNINEYEDTTRSHLFPLSVNIKDLHIFVSNNYSTDSSIVQKTEILSINGISAEEIVNTILESISGYRQESVNYRAGRSFKYYYWEKYGLSENYRIKLRLPDSTKINQKIISGISWSEYRNRSNSKKNTVNNKYTFYKIEDGSIGGIIFRSMSEQKDFKEFLKQTFGQIKKENIQHLIINIRKNGGGDSRLGDNLINYITDKPTTMAERMDVKTSRFARKHLRDRPGNWYKYPSLPLSIFHPGSRAFYFKPNSIFTIEGEVEPQKRNPLRFTGETYLLTSLNTFSSASMLASTFKCFELGTIVGEETGGLTVSYGEFIRFYLPNTGIRCGVSHKRFVQACGKEDGHGVIPDYEVKQTPEDREKGIDTVMEFTKQLIKESESIGN